MEECPTGTPPARNSPYLLLLSLSSPWLFRAYLYPTQLFPHDEALQRSVLESKSEAMPILQTKALSRCARRCAKCELQVLRESKLICPFH